MKIDKRKGIIITLVVVLLVVVAVVTFAILRRSPESSSVPADNTGMVVRVTGTAGIGISGVYGIYGGQLTYVENTVPWSSQPFHCEGPLMAAFNALDPGALTVTLVLNGTAVKTWTDDGVSHLAYVNLGYPC